MMKLLILYLEKEKKINPEVLYSVGDTLNKRLKSSTEVDNLEN